MWQENQYQSLLPLLETCRDATTEWCRAEVKHGGYFDSKELLEWRCSAEERRDNQVSHFTFKAATVHANSFRDTALPGPIADGQRTINGHSKGANGKRYWNDESLLLCRLGQIRHSKCIDEVGQAFEQAIAITFIALEFFTDNCSWIVSSLRAARHEEPLWHVSEEARWTCA